MDRFLKFCAAISLLVIAASVGYYFSVYLPQRDAMMDRDRKLEQAKAEMIKRAEQQRISDEKAASIKREEAASEAKQIAYRMCIASAEDNYLKNWASTCREAAQNANKRRADCQKSSISTVQTCESLHPVLDAGPNCTLSGGAVLNERLEKARNRCLEESKSGVQ